MTMKTMYVAEETEPSVLRCALSPRLIAPPTMGPLAFVADQYQTQFEKELGSLPSQSAIWQERMLGRLVTDNQ